MTIKLHLELYLWDRILWLLQASLFNSWCPFQFSMQIWSWLGFGRAMQGKKSNLSVFFPTIFPMLAIFLSAYSLSLSLSLSQRASLCREYIRMVVGRVLGDRFFFQSAQETNPVRSENHPLFHDVFRKPGFWLWYWHRTLLISLPPWSQQLPGHQRQGEVAWFGRLRRRRLPYEELWQGLGERVRVSLIWGQFHSKKKLSFTRLCLQYAH